MLVGEISNALLSFDAISEEKAHCDVNGLMGVFSRLYDQRYRDVDATSLRKT